MNRKSATKLLLVQWSRFQNVLIQLNGSALITGVNGSGKSTILDAMIYMLTGSTKFNLAARDSDRSVVRYVRGDTNSEGSDRYLRSGEVICYIAMEFESPLDNSTMVVGVCIESKDINDYHPYWFALENTTIEQMKFTYRENGKMFVTPKNQLVYKGKKMRVADFMGRDKGVDTILRALGLRCDRKTYQSKIIKMMAFNPENNIDRFIQESVLDEKNVDSLKTLREQRNHFDEITAMYNQANESRKQLAIILEQSENYDKVNSNYHIRNMMLNYQRIKEYEKQVEDNLIHIESLKVQIEILKKESDKYKQQYELAMQRKFQLENDEQHKALLTRIEDLEKDITNLKLEIKKNQEAITKLDLFNTTLTKLQKNIPELVFEKVDFNDKQLPLDKKINTFHSIVNTLKNGENDLYERLQDHRIEYKTLLEHIRELEEEIKQLQANIVPIPKDYEQCRSMIENEFHKRGKDVEVYFFASKVKEFVDEKWRLAIETFLKNKRYDILVDGMYAKEALDILHNSKYNKANVVITDKLPESTITANSAASMLEIPNEYARRYANYLLNGIHLCKDVDELHEYPKGGLMQDGMLAKSFRASNMDLSKTKVCMGNGAIEIRLKAAKKELEKCLKQRDELNRMITKLNEQIRCIRDIDLVIDHYDFSAAINKEKNLIAQKQKEATIKEIKTDKGFLTLSNQIDELERECRTLYNQFEKKNREAITKDNRVGEIERQNEVLASQKKEQLYLLEEKVGNNQSLKNQMIEQYNELSTKRNSIIVVSEKRVDDLRREKDSINNELVTLQVAYSRLEGIEATRLGAQHIPYYRKKYNDLVNVQIEEIQRRLSEQSKKLEEVFIIDFIGELKEKIDQAKKEIEKINNELRYLPFGNDTYRFELLNKTDRDAFFRIVKKIEEDYSLGANTYMYSSRNDEVMERDITDFMNTILDCEDETEYTDYRNYFKYDMKITSRQGDFHSTANLSKKQGSASNGEKQTPYFIILAASLMQCYPRNKSCARLAFIDEAFSALSKERIEQMVKYFESNDFQIIYAAPPEKISSIGSHINTTVSLVKTGKYTDVIEGVNYEVE